MISLHEILGAASAISGVSGRGIFGKSKIDIYVDVRFAIAAVASEEGYSLSSIGKFLCKDHTTVLHYIKNLHRRPLAARLADRMRDVLGEVDRYEWARMWANAHDSMPKAEPLPAGPKQNPAFDVVVSLDEDDSEICSTLWYVRNDRRFRRAMEAVVGSFPQA